MIVKGVAFLAREQMLIAAHGEPAWKGFLKDFAASEPTFPFPILPISRIPAEAFLRFNEALTRHFYAGDQSLWWAYGEQSAQYALGKGQLKGLFKPGEITKFLLFTPAIWKGYFDAGELTCQVKGKVAEMRITSPIQHVYFEYSVIGFARGGMKFLQAAHPEPEFVRGFSKGDDEVVYRFVID